ncbi:hypothetical protein [Prosthecobacter fusiformis]|uniref:hypothetical protein n=1 Tax=Prosthecobacter fusiformis TaxID=48464 RepID=UPI00105FA945|nr:hypothetical protein [Prosthecobacter fusiformis]
MTSTFQPLDGLGSGRIVIAAVTCHDWYAHSGQATEVSLITAVNVPPTNNCQQANRDLNLASVCGVTFSTSDLGAFQAPLELTMDVTRFALPERGGHAKEDIIRASLECLRRCLPEKLRQTPLKLKAGDEQKSWVEKIITEFNSHDRSQAFYTPPP